MDIFNFQDLTSEFSVLDIVTVMVLSFVLSTFIGWIYKITHRGSSYTQSFVLTLVMNSMIMALIMMIVGSNIARAFSLVGALSIIRFRNAVKETRDVGFIFTTALTVLRNTIRETFNSLTDQIRIVRSQWMAVRRSMAVSSLANKRITRRSAGGTRSRRR